jgi:hypothetical protein
MKQAPDKRVRVKTRKRPGIPSGLPFLLLLHKDHPLYMITVYTILSRVKSLSQN